VPADAVDGDALGDLRVAVMEDHLAGIEPPDRLADMARGEGHAQRVVAHAGAGGVGHLRRLHVQRGVGKQRQTAGVIVVEMGDDDAVDGFGRDAEGRQRGDGVEPDRASAVGGLGAVIAGVDQNGLAAAAQQPHEIIHRVRRVMRVVEDEAVRAHARVAVGVFDREHLPRAHAWTVR
jgi:hypothetical protein